MTKRQAVLFLGSVVTAVGLCGSCSVREVAAEEPGSTESPEAVGDSVAIGNVLADTSWRLIEFQSMDDSVGVIEPADPSLYTMTLNADGSVNMALNCNTAMGTWVVDFGDSEESGSFSFGPLAGTWALCPPPSMDQRILADSEWVRGFIIRNGNLYLSLMAEGGIYAWEPQGEVRSAGVREVPFEAGSDASIEAAILAATPDYDAESIEILGREARYVYSRYDLNDDGIEELVVLMMGPVFCGTGGCDMFLLRVAGDGYQVLQRFVRTSSPVIVTSATTGGWRDLVRLESGGGMPASYVRHAFDGTQYVEAERTDGDEQPAGAELLAGEYSYAVGAPLQPGS
jgi:heat shock protein HslJ